MLKMVGNSGQLSLGKKYAGRYFKVEHQPDGAVLLRPMTLVPSTEAWAHEPAMLDQLRSGEAWAKRTPPAAAGPAGAAPAAASASCVYALSSVFANARKPSRMGR